MHPLLPLRVGDVKRLRREIGDRPPRPKVKRYLADTDPAFAALAEAAQKRQIDNAMRRLRRKVKKTRH
jgi:hypothetical protein